MEIIALLIEDEEESLRLLLETLPKSIAGCEISWDGCDSFDAAKIKIQNQRYDLVVTDIYLGPVEKDDFEGIHIVDKIREIRFCPVLAISYGSCPEKLKTGPFVLFADKSDMTAVNSGIAELLNTGIPQISKKLHDELDKVGQEYLWGFLENEWNKLKEHGITDEDILERLVRRRASIRIAKLNPEKETPIEIEHVEGLEYYIYPPVSGGLRLGEILKNNSDSSLRIVLTPHCNLTIQPGDAWPRAEYVLTVKAFPALDIIEKTHAGINGKKKNPWSGEKIDMLRKRIQMPALKLGKPQGRYCFLPAFLEIPNIYCDLSQIESIPYKVIEADYKRIAVIDTPFAESLQACFVRFYSNVGTPNLRPERFEDLLGDMSKEDEKKS